MRKKFNEEFHRSCMRMNFWDRLRLSLEQVETLTEARGSLTHEDIRVLKIIREAIRESSKRSARAESYHRRRLEQLRKEYLYQ